MKTYQKLKNDYINHVDKPSLTTIILFIAVFIFAIMTVFYAFNNSREMNKNSEDSIRNYANNISNQIAETVSTDVDDIKSMLKAIDESIALFYEDGIDETSDDEYIEKYLNNACQSTRFDSLVYLKADGTKLIGGSLDENIINQYSEEFEPVKQAKDNTKAIAYVLNENILFVDSIFSSTNNFLGYVIGSIKTEDVKQTIDIQVYGKNNNFCLTNNVGDVLIESKEERLIEFGEYIKNNPELVESITADYNKRKQGLVEATLSDGGIYYFVYSPIEGEDWILVTLVSVKDISGVYITYMNRSLTTILAAVFIFVMLLGLLGISYRRNRKQLEYLLFTDKLTGGPNINDFQLRYRRIQKKVDVTKYAIVMLDIKDFKLINETLGFENGDKVLKNVYDSIDKELDKKRHEFASRIEMDHYALFLNENTKEGIQQRIKNITQNANKDINGNDYIYHIEFYQGACLIDDPKTDISVLEENARIARQNLNNDNPNECSFYSQEMYKRLYDNRVLNKMAEESIKNHDFVVYYQPKVSISRNKVKGAEALVRWQHPEKGLIAPYLFVPVLEESGMVKEVDKYVFEEVCKWLEKRKKDGKELFPVSINLSRKHFWKKNFFDDYLEIFKKYDVDSKYIIFEITEGVFVDDEKHRRIKEGIAQMHEHGFKCSVDDFGTGYSSLSLIHEMDVDELKFDRSFFTDLEDDKARKIASSLINMASDLQLDTVIEGIETDDQLEFLKKQHCDIVQGYYYSKPLPEEEFNKFVDEFNSH